MPPLSFAPESQLAILTNPDLQLSHHLKCIDVSNPECPAYIWILTFALDILIVLLMCNHYAIFARAYAINQPSATVANWALAASVN